MAVCTEFTCNHCGFKVESWSDGFAYLKDNRGKRRYFFHPAGADEMWEFCRRQLGNPQVSYEEFERFLQERRGWEDNFICMHCGRQTRRDLSEISMRCTRCRKQELKPTQALEGQRCPKCKQGIFSGVCTAIS